MFFMTQTAPAAAERSDAELLRAYAGGDAASFDALYARHEGALYRFVKRVLGASLAAQADEVFQDCWLRIIGAAAGYDSSQASFKTWAFTIAHRLALDRLRLSGRELGVDDGDESCAVDTLDAAAERAGLSAGSAEDAAHWQAAGRRLAHCLEQLSADQRAAFLLHHEDGLSVADAARELGIAFEAAKSRLRYAMQKLRGCMGAFMASIDGAAT
jgi:RNA polymerase sigma factor (sigma-70 family)